MDGWRGDLEKTQSKILKAFLSYSSPYFLSDFAVFSSMRLTFLPTAFKLSNNFLEAFRKISWIWNDKVPKLRRCVKYTLQKYTLKIEVQKQLASFQKIFLSPVVYVCSVCKCKCNGRETPTQWKSESVTFWQPTNQLSGLGSKDAYTCLKSCSFTQMYYIFKLSKCSLCCLNKILLNFL